MTRKRSKRELVAELEAKLVLVQTTTLDMRGDINELLEVIRAAADEAGEDE